MPNVFISYAHADRDAIRPIISAIRRAELDPIDASHMSPGMSWDAFIDQAMRSAECAVVIWSDAAAGSASVQQEIHRAIQAWSEDRLVLARLDGTPLPAGLADLPAIDIGGPFPEIGAAEVARAARGVMDRHLPPVASEMTLPASGRTDYSTSRGSHRDTGSKWPWLAGAMVFLVAVGAGLSTLRLSKPAVVVMETTKPPVVQPIAKSLDPGLGVAMLAALGGIGALIWLVRRMSRRVSHDQASVTAQDIGKASLGAASARSGPHDIFVSYSRHDAAVVDRLVKEIERAGFTVWMDRTAAHGAERYAAPIVKAIKSSRIVALMCSQNAFSSASVIREVYVAGDSRKSFLAIQLDGAEFPDEVQYFVSGFPRLPVEHFDAGSVRAEIARLIAT